MADMLTLTDWWPIIVHLSLDAPRPLYRSMGLGLATDVHFGRLLQDDLRGLREPFAISAESEAFLARVFERAAQQEGDYVQRLRDWGTFIHSNALPLQDQLFRWQYLFIGGEASAQEPALVSRLRRVLGSLEVVNADAIRPVSEWDMNYSTWSASEGLPQFEWVELAVANFQFLYGWEAATKGAPASDEIEALYLWGLAEAKRQNFSPERLKSPGWFQLPASLRTP